MSVRKIKYDKINSKLSLELTQKSNHTQLISVMMNKQSIYKPFEHGLH